MTTATIYDTTVIIKGKTYRLGDMTGADFKRLAARDKELSMKSVKTGVDLTSKEAAELQSIATFIARARAR